MHYATTLLHELDTLVRNATFHIMRSLLPEGKPAFKNGVVNFNISINGVADKRTFVLDQKWYPLARVSYEKEDRVDSCFDNKLVTDWDDIRLSKDLSETTSTPVLN